MILKIFNHLINKMIYKNIKIYNKKIMIYKINYDKKINKLNTNLII